MEHAKIDKTDELLAVRGTQHGDIRDHAGFTQAAKRIMHSSKNWHLIDDTKRECLEMIQHKIGRILSGDPDHPDHFDDICGYARLANHETMERLKNELSLVENQIAVIPPDAPNKRSFAIKAAWRRRKLAVKKPAKKPVKAKRKTR